jgi:hypothetical protein
MESDDGDDDGDNCNNNIMNKTAASAASTTNDNLLEVLEHTLGGEIFRTHPDRP